MDNRIYGVLKEKSNLLLYDYETVCGSSLPDNEIPEEFMLPEDRIPTCRDQKWTGQCVAFATAGVLEILNYIETGVRKLFSTTYIYGKHRTEGARNVIGSYTQMVLQHLCFLGSIPNDMMPELYENPEAYDFVHKASNYEECERIASETHIDSYISFNTATWTKREKLVKTALLKYQVPLVMIYRVTDTESHAVALVGWTKDKWKFMNSWGENYGKRGIGSISYKKEKAVFLLLDAKNTPKFPFTDVSEEHWAYHAIQRCFSAGIINGIDDTTFAPENTLTKAQVCQALYKLAKKIAIRNEEDFKEPSGSIYFEDVKQGQWFYNAIKYCVKKGLILAEGNLFNPDSNISRSEFCSVIYAFIMKHCKSKKITNCNMVKMPFSDVEKTDKNYNAINACYSLELINGVNETCFEPKSTLNRGHLCQIIYKFVKLIEKHEG